MQSKILDIERVGPYSGDMYCFSDGVGRISPELLEKVLEALPFVPSDRPQISAIQVGKHKDYTHSDIFACRITLQQQPNGCQGLTSTTCVLYKGML